MIYYLLKQKLMSKVMGSIILLGFSSFAYSSPYTFKVSQSVLADTNVFRAPDNQTAMRDLVSSSGLGLEVDQYFGRKRLKGGIDFNFNRYKNNTQLNGVDRRLAVSLDWETVENLSGSLFYNEKSNQYKYDLDRQSSFTGKNILTDHALGTQIRLGSQSQWVLEGGWLLNEQKYSADIFKNRNLKSSTLNTGVRWNVDEEVVSMNLGATHAQGKYPNSGIANDEFDRTDLELGVKVNPGGLSDFNGRIGVTQEQYSVRGRSEVQTWIGDLEWNWRPTGKLNLKTRFSRDTYTGDISSQSSIVSPDGFFDSTDTRIKNNLQLSAFWDVTAKIELTTKYSYAKRRLDNSFSSGSVFLPIEGKDSTSMLTLGVNLRPLRTVEVGCELARERRRTNNENLSISYPYGGTTAGCSLQLRFQ